MMKVMLAATTVLALGAFTALPPAFANNLNTANANITQASDPNDTNTSGPQKLVNDAAQALQKAKQQQHFDALLRQAKGVFIMPMHVKGAFGIGGAGGEGVLLARGPNGRWSDPAFMTLGSISLGAQAGGKAGTSIMLLMTDKALNDFRNANNFSLNANAGLTIADYSAQGQAAAGKDDVIIWSQNKGAFAGADISVTDITANTGQDAAYYGKSVSTADILNGQVQNPQANTLRMELPA